MNEYHKHEGISKKHLISVEHKDARAKKAHDTALIRQTLEQAQKELKTAPTKQPQTKLAEYVISNESTSIIVKFNARQLAEMTDALQKSGAMEIGVAVKPL